MEPWSHSEINEKKDVDINHDSGTAVRHIDIRKSWDNTFNAIRGRHTVASFDRERKFIGPLPAFHCLVGLVATSEFRWTITTKNLHGCLIGRPLVGGSGYMGTQRDFSSAYYKVNIFLSLYSSRWMNIKFYFFISFLFPYFNLLSASAAIILYFSFRVYVFLLLELIIYTKNIQNGKNTLSLPPPPSSSVVRRLDRRHTFDPKDTERRRMHIKCGHARNEVSVEILFCCAQTNGTYRRIRRRTLYFCPKMRRRKEMTIYKKSNSVSFRVL